VIEQRLASAPEEGLLAGRVQIAQLTLQRRVVQDRGRTSPPWQSPSIRLAAAVAACRRARPRRCRYTPRSAVGGALPGRLVDAAISLPRACSASEAHPARPMGQIATAQPVASSDLVAACSGEGRGNQCYWQNKGCGSRRWSSSGICRLPCPVHCRTRCSRPAGSNELTQPGLLCPAVLVQSARGPEYDYSASTVDCRRCDGDTTCGLSTAPRGGTAESATHGCVVRPLCPGDPGKRPRSRSDRRAFRQVNVGVMGLAGIEPAPSSLSDIEGSALCGAAFPQVTAERQGLRDACLAASFQAVQAH
jgi:hypothetical protein